MSKRHTTYCHACSAAVSMRVVKWRSGDAAFVAVEPFGFPAVTQSYISRILRSTGVWRRDRRAARDCTMLRMASAGASHRQIADHLRTAGHQITQGGVSRALLRHGVRTRVPSPDRDRAILDLAAGGQTQAEIAAALSARGYEPISQTQISAVLVAHGRRRHRYSPRRQAVA